jgi:Fe2+ or Zn2+ uptake regulation protein
MDRFEELKKRFKQCGYKMTRQRRIILKAIAGPTSHPTAEQIYEVVRECIPETSLATVYNTLRELVSIKEAYELDVGHGVRRYEISQVEHAHLVCLECRQIQDMPRDFAQVKSLFSHVNGFCPTLYAVTIYGYCANCVPSLHL